LLLAGIVAVVIVIAVALSGAILDIINIFPPPRRRVVAGGHHTDPGQAGRASGRPAPFRGHLIQ
jgi:hypothetical protein